MTAAQAAILARVRTEGATVFDARKRKAVYALEAAGLVTVQENFWYLAREKRGGRSYTVTAVGEVCSCVTADATDKANEACRVHGWAVNPF